MVPYSTSSLGKESGTGLSNELPLYLLVIFVTFSPAVIYIFCLWYDIYIRVVLHIFCIYYCWIFPASFVNYSNLYSL